MADRLVDDALAVHRRGVRFSTDQLRGYARALLVPAMEGQDVDHKRLALVLECLVLREER